MYQRLHLLNIATHRYQNLNLLNISTCRYQDLYLLSIATYMYQSLHLLHRYLNINLQDFKIFKTLSIKLRHP